jgi:hypothetical protein
MDGTDDQSNIYHFKKQIVEKLTSQAKILMICIGFYFDMNQQARPWYPDW